MRSLCELLQFFTNGPISTKFGMKVLPLEDTPTSTTFSFVHSVITRWQTHDFLCGSETNGISVPTNSKSTFMKMATVRHFVFMSDKEKEKTTTATTTTTTTTTTTGAAAANTSTS